MQSLLPKVESTEDFRRLRRNPVDFWAPALGEIASRHGLKPRAITRFASGENPVFSLDDRWVLKLVPRLWSNVISREVDCLEFLANRASIPVSTLKGHGELDGWHYMISTRLPGVPLSDAWSSLDGIAKEHIARKFGALLGVLHGVPLEGFKPGGIEWKTTIERWTASWSSRDDIVTLPDALRDTAESYIECANIDADESSMVLLHGDLAPENLLVTEHHGIWSCSGIFDFGNSITGKALFDLTGCTVLLAPGDGAIIRVFLEGYGLRSTSLRELRRLLMAYTLLHPMAHLPSILKLIPGLEQAASWEHVAERLWPT